MNEKIKLGQVTLPDNVTRKTHLLYVDGNLNVYAVPMSRGGKMNPEKRKKNQVKRDKKKATLFASLQKQMESLALQKVRLELKQEKFDKKMRGA